MRKYLYDRLLPSLIQLIYFCRCFRTFSPFSLFVSEKEAAERFEEESGVSADIDLSLLDNRINIRDAIQVQNLADICTYIPTSLHHQWHMKLQNLACFQCVPELKECTMPPLSFNAFFFVRSGKICQEIVQSLVSQCISIFCVLAVETYAKQLFISAFSMYFWYT